METKKKHTHRISPLNSGRQTANANLKPTLNNQCCPDFALNAHLVQYEFRGLQNSQNTTTSTTFHERIFAVFKDFANPQKFMSAKVLLIYSPTANVSASETFLNFTSAKFYK